MKPYWIIDALIQQGVTHFCIAPGSRSTPLILALTLHKKAKIHVHLDERGLAFFALGIAKAFESPVAIIVTSGTAVGNLLPAVMEAHHFKTPLVLLTADRPLELRNSGANQTTDQVKLFERFVRFEMDLQSELSESVIRSIIADAIFHASDGPVHLNCPFKEPLYTEDLPPLKEGKPIQIFQGSLSAPPIERNASKGLILIGKLPCKEDILAPLNLASRLNWPFFADILSNARLYKRKEEIRYFDFIEKPTPELILHFGERLTSKKIPLWIRETGAEYIHISPTKDLQDPERIQKVRVRSDSLPFSLSFKAGSDPNWISSWEDAVLEFPENFPFTEIDAMLFLSKLPLKKWAIFLGNGMPIRDADHFLFPSECEGFYANRGLSGIDGNIATISGLAEKHPVLAIIGDQAAFYDLNSLSLLKKSKHPVLLLISNNFGGGMFHHLPVRNHPQFETFWAMNHEKSFKKFAESEEIPYFLFHEIKTALNMGCSTIVELITDRQKNYEYQSSYRLSSRVFGKQNRLEPSPISLK